MTKAELIDRLEDALEWDKVDEAWYWLKVLDDEHMLDSVEFDDYAWSLERAEARAQAAAIEFAKEWSWPGISKKEEP